MTNTIKYTNDRPEWEALASHFHDIKNKHMREWFADDPHRFENFSINWGDFLLDYSRNRIDQNTVKLLSELAAACQLPEKLNALFTGEPVNSTEMKPALHAALRDKQHANILINEKVTHAREKMFGIVDQIHSKKWLGATGKPIEFVVNIGIGGSHIGPMMCCEALKSFAISNLQFHFISSIDTAQLNEVLQKIDPEKTLFIVSSKSFTTLETLTNATTILTWMREKVGESALKHHFIAVTAAIEKAHAFGFAETNILPIWDWVGGRYSIWSSIGIPLALMVGSKNFDDFLHGAHQMDEHVKHAEYSQNLPVMMALLSIWYINFFDTRVHAVIPYSSKLKYFITYLQQAFMESNGKQVNHAGMNLPFNTSPVIFGDEGCNGQHAYHQLLHQGTQLIPADMILIATPDANVINHHNTLVASGLSQAQALMRGKTKIEIEKELHALNFSETEIKRLTNHLIIPGNKPVNILVIKNLTPKNLGSLIALYEYIIFIQSVIWDINPFDQWGVELGKQLLPTILKNFDNDMTSYADNAELMGLINHFKKNKA